MVGKNCGSEKILYLKKSLVQKHFKKRMNHKKLGQKCVVKIGPLISEILQIWTNVARVYVAWTNVTVAVYIF